MEYYIAIDIGATWTRIALCTQNTILEKVSYETPRSGDELTIAKSIIQVIGEKWRNKLHEIKVVGIATIGPLDIVNGRVVNTPNLPIHNFKLLEPLVSELKIPVYVANDAVASAWGEKHYGDAKYVDNSVYITLSTGVGGGVVVNGNLLIGKLGNAHEIGHIVVDYNSDFKCGCGGYGHWEAYAGGANLPRLAKYILEKQAKYSNTDLGRLLVEGGVVDAKTIFEYYRKGDKLAMETINTYIKATAAGIASVINVYDPDLITIGGSVFLNNIDILYNPIIELTKKNIITGMPLIKPTSLGDDIGIYGALSIAINTPVTLQKIQDPLIKKLLYYY